MSAVYTPFNEDESSKEADAEIQALIDQLEAEIKAKCDNADTLKAVSFYTRCHGGNIHYIKVQTGPETFAHVTISKSFMGKSPSVADVLCNKKKDDPVEAFGLAY